MNRLASINVMVRQRLQYRRDQVLSSSVLDAYLESNPHQIENGSDLQLEPLTLSLAFYCSRLVIRHSRDTEMYVPMDQFIEWKMRQLLL